MVATQDILAQRDPVTWVVSSGIEVDGARMDFTNRAYQIAIMRDNARRVCVRKGTQGGITLLKVLTSFHRLIYSEYSKGIIYLFPTQDDVEDFSKSRFAPLIDTNVAQIGKYVKAGGKGADSAFLKRIGKAWLYLRGSRSETKLRSAPADEVIFDEFDMMEPGVAELARGRLGDSPFKREFYLSNPKEPGCLIDECFLQSDQRYWVRQCTCGWEFCPDKEFPKGIREGKDGKGYYACAKCDKPLSIDRGNWIAEYSKNASYMHGYQWSQLNSLHNDPLEILRETETLKGEALDKTYQMRLGLPHVCEENKLSESMVKRNCGQNVPASSDSGPCAMGVDRRHGEKHVVILKRTSRERFEMVRNICVAEWEDLHDLAKRYNVKVSVVDIGPESDDAYKFQKAEPYKVWLCRYADAWDSQPEYNDDSGIVKADRTSILNQTHKLFEDRRLVIPRWCPEVETFILQCIAPAKRPETNSKTGRTVYRYFNSKPDHYRHALNYALLAAMKCPISNPTSFRTQQNEMVVHEYQMF